MTITVEKDLDLIPIGTIIFVAEHITGVSAPGDNFQLCDGSVIVGGPMNGQNVPNLASRFLRGNTTSGGTGGSTTHSHSWPSWPTDGGGSGTITGTPVSQLAFPSANHEPSYFQLIAYMRVR